ELGGHNRAIGQANGEVEVGDDAIEHQEGALESIAVLQSPCAWIARKSGDEAQSQKVLGPAIANRVALGRIRSRQGCADQAGRAGEGSITPPRRSPIAT